MAQLRDDIVQFLKRNAAIVVVGPESADAFKAYWEKHRLPFIGLPDPDHTVLKRYGQQVKLFKLGRMPAQVIVDTKGRVRFVHYGHAMTDIPPNSELLGILDNFEKD